MAIGPIYFNLNSSFGSNLNRSLQYEENGDFVGGEVGVELGRRWGELGIRLGWGEKAENCT